MTSTNIKFKCKSWIDTFGQRSNKAAGSLITNQFANSMVDLVIREPAALFDLWPNVSIHDLHLNFIFVDVIYEEKNKDSMRNS